MRSAHGIALLLLVLGGCSDSPDRGFRRAVEPELVAGPALAPPQEAIGVEEEKLREQVGDSRPEIAIRATAKLGLLLAAQGRYEEAEPLLRDAARDYIDLRPFLELELSDVLIEMGRFDDSVGLLSTVSRETEAVSARTTARIRLPAALALAGRSDEATAAAEALMSVPLNEFTEPLLIATADTLAGSGAYSSAQRVRERIITEYPQGRYTEKLYDQLVELRGARSRLIELSFDEGVRFAEKLADANRFREAQDYIARLKTRFPEQRADDDLRWIEARAAFSSRDYERVRKLTLPESSRRHAELERLRGHASWRLDRDQEFLAAMRHVIREHPDSPEAGTARILLGKFYISDGGHPDEAARYFAEAVEAGDEGPGGENLWTLIWTLITADRDQEAIEQIESYLSKYPDDTYTTNSLFWLGKLRQEKGDTTGRDSAWDRLITDYPYAYYSYRVREILQLPPPPDEIRSGHEFPKPDYTSASFVRKASDLSLASELELIGLEQEATRVYREAVGTNPDSKYLAYLLASYYERAGEPLQAIMTLTREFDDLIRHGGTGIPRRFWEILYPIRWWDTIEAAAEKAGVDPFLMAAIIRQESGWDPSIVSSAGAVGAMQIMPHLAPHLGRSAGFDRPIGREDLFDPEINIRLGAVEIVDKTRAMNGRLPLAIASYNAGQGRVRSWLRRTPADDIDFFIDSIPFLETRRYVMAVTRNREEYERIYGPGGVAAIEEREE